MKLRLLTIQWSCSFSSLIEIQNLQGGHVGKVGAVTTLWALWCKPTRSLLEFVGMPNFIGCALRTGILPLQNGPGLCPCNYPVSSASVPVAFLCSINRFKLMQTWQMFPQIYPNQSNRIDNWKGISKTTYLLNINSSIVTKWFNFIL